MRRNAVSTGLCGTAGDADEGQLPEEAAPPAEAAEPAVPSGADQSAAAQRALAGAADGHAQQLHPPQASGHGGAADEDPDELDLYGDMAGAAASQRPVYQSASCARVWRPRRAAHEDH